MAKTFTAIFVRKIKLKTSFFYSEKCDWYYVCSLFGFNKRATAHIS
jgi:hypothetical protein